MVSKSLMSGLPLIDRHRYVLSTTHLHEFKSPDRISTQTPVMSLPLADQKLCSHSNADSTSHKFMLKGRQSGGMHRGHAWVFRAESYDTMLGWFSDIKNLTEKTGLEREAFIRRTHARSVSGGSNKAGSVGSDSALDEDEADQVPYSAAASQVEVAPEEEKLPQRPNPGGRFPSALNVNRDSQIPLSPSSPSSSGDREIIAAAGALPGSGVPFGESGQQVQARDDETNAARGELGATSGAPMHQDRFSPIAAQQEYNGLPVQQGANPVTMHGAEYINSPVQAQGVSSGDSGDVAYSQQQPLNPAQRSVPQHAQMHGSNDGDLMGPTAAGAGGATIGAAGTEAYRQHEDHKAITQEEHPSLQAVDTAPTSMQQQAPIQGAIFAAHSSSVADTASLNTVSTVNEPPAVSGSSLSALADPAAPIKNLADRPPLDSHASVATIGELHVPGEFPRGGRMADVL